MNDYNLDPGEFIILQNGRVAFEPIETETMLREIVLTNTHFILVATRESGLLSYETLVKRCPLDQLLIDNDSSGARVGEKNGKCILQVLFQSETITVSIAGGSRRLASAWADAIASAAAGDFSIAGTAGDKGGKGAGVPDELAGLIDNAKGLASGIMGGLGNFGALGGGRARAEAVRAQPATPARARTNVQVKCQGCHAPLSGRQGASVTCPYCDTKQTL